jgi:hypothetical protein
MINKDFLYAGAELDSASSELLRKFHKEGWRFYGHHMTIHFGLSTLPKSTEMWLKDNVSKEYPLTIIAIGHSNKAIAALVKENEIPCSNKLRHITVSVAPDGKPVDSNKIKEWQPIEPFTVITNITVYQKTK